MGVCPDCVPCYRYFTDLGLAQEWTVLAGFEIENIPFTIIIISSVAKVHRIEIDREFDLQFIGELQQVIRCSKVVVDAEKHHAASFPAQKFVGVSGKLVPLISEMVDHFLERGVVTGFDFVKVDAQTTWQIS